MKGTLLLFDLTKPLVTPDGKPPEHFRTKLIKSSLRPMLRVIPNFTWTRKGAAVDDPNGRVSLVTDAVYVGRIWMSAFWSFLLVGATILFIMYISIKNKKGILGAIRSDRGYLSLSRTQIACWTIVIGWMVFTYGVMRLDVPNIPYTLVVMMGLSLFTSVAQNTKENANASKDISMTHQPAGVSDFIVDPVTGSLSLPKAQMLFWTVLSIVLFLYKSLAEGRLWAIPEELVVLMGASQAGYLTRDLGFKSVGGVAKADVQENTAPEKAS